ncbi:MAG: hypothetical protein AAF388_01215 [Bacteroidota bacterium]
MSPKELRIALVKQDVLPDLYIAPVEATALEILHSTMMRVGPVGLFSDFHTDFHIVKESDSPECAIWKEIISTPGPDKPEDFRALKNTPLNLLKGQGHKSPGTSDTHDRYAVSYDELDWGQYDIVISINIAVPRAHITKYPKVLWCYMAMEANMLMDKVHFGYDVCLNQEIRGYISKGMGILDFPYTFLGPKTLEELTQSYLNRPSKNEGIYADSTVVKERPVKQVPHFEPLTRTGHPILIHRQLITENLEALYDAKYYLKIGGRGTRGNGLIEAVSSGTLVLMEPENVRYSQLLPKECWVDSIDEALQKIQFLEENPHIYEELLALQRRLLQHFVIDCPMRSLVNALEEKRRDQSELMENTNFGKYKALATPVKSFSKWLEKVAVKLEYM